MTPTNAFFGNVSLIWQSSIKFLKGFSVTCMVKLLLKKNVHYYRRKTELETRRPFVQISLTVNPIQRCVSNFGFCFLFRRCRISHFSNGEKTDIRMEVSRILLQLHEFTQLTKRKWRPMSMNYNVELSRRKEVLWFLVHAEFNVQKSNKFFF